ncbi:TLC domain-containing protein [Ephemerocybe angulata]|uniref:TLC domain-containing protein n=1 Tax=Ephemerocybe angulata TaxID=980116 RepID=A0A8H6IEE4_9AGAR|nr:TLC domain-containing protein [Tulosesus angulatus]
MSPAFIDRFLSETLGLTKIPDYLPTLYLSFLGFTLVHLVLAPWLSAKIAPQSWGALKGRKARNNWSIHVVSQVHTLIIVPMSIWCIWKEDGALDSDRAFGWDDRVGYTYAVACGYFIWDTLDAIYNFVDVGFVIHGVACTLIYSMSYRPFVAYYGARCLLWEISTFFLNIHWFLDKTNRTGSTLQLANGVALLFAFFSVRLVYGGSISYQFFVTLLNIWRQMPFAYTFVFGLGNFALQGLNWLWFSKMIAAIRKRFNGSEESKSLMAHDELPAPASP